MSARRPGLLPMQGNQTVFFLPPFSVSEDSDLCFARGVPRPLPEAETPGDEAESQPAEAPSEKSHDSSSFLFSAVRFCFCACMIPRFSGKGEKHDETHG